MKTYEELITLPTLKERFKYLSKGQKPAEETFGQDRYFNQQFYRSQEWQHAKRAVIVRDEGSELAVVEYPIQGRIYVHHIEPITIEDVKNHSSKLFDHNNLICCSFKMHQAIHYRDESFLEIYEWKERKRNDTSPWL